jgi:hypothetical protein
VASGVVLFLLIPVGWYGAYRANQRYDQGGRLVDAAQETAVARQHRPRPCSPGAVAFVAGEGATRTARAPGRHHTRAHRSPDRRGIGKNGRGPAGLSSGWPASRRPRPGPPAAAAPAPDTGRCRPASPRPPPAPGQRTAHTPASGVLLITPPPLPANREGAWAIDCSAEGTRSASTLVGTGQLATTAGDPHLRMGPACGSSCDDPARLPGRPVRGRAFE